MQSLAISNLASAGAPLPGSLATNASSKATDAPGMPGFAQAVRDVLNRNTTSSANSSGTQAATPSKARSSSKSSAPTKAPTLAKDALQAIHTSEAATPANIVSLPNLLATSLSAPIPGASFAGDPELPVHSATSDTGVTPPVAPANSATNAGSGTPRGVTPAADSEDDALLAQTAGLTLAEQIAALPSVAFAPISSDASPAPSSAADYTKASDGSTASAQPALRTASGSSTAAPATVSGPQTNLTILLVADAASAADGQPIASLLPQISRLQSDTVAAHEHLHAPAFADTHVPYEQNPQATQNEPFAHASSQSLAIRLATPPASPATPKGLQAIGNETSNPVQAENPSSASSDHAGSHDATSDGKESGRADAPASADASTSASAAHDATSFSQALVTAASVKQDAAATPDTPTVASAGAPAASPDRAANSPSSIAPSAPAPAPSSLPPSVPDGASNRLVDSAKLVEAAGHSEMRIAMETDRLGPVELRAQMNGDQVGAAITVEKRDAHAALAVELPALQQALSDKQLRVDQVTLLHGSLGSTAGDAGASARQQQRSGQQTAANPWSVGAGGVSQIFTSSEQSGSFDSQGRLSVHA
jgi:flagellar hook-length control protein FliK